MTPFDALAYLFTTFLSGQWILGYLIFAMAVDWCSGSLAAAKTGTMNSSAGRSGTIKKAALLLASVTVVGLQPLFTALGFGFITSAVLFPFLIHELQSIIENLSDCGVTMPDMFVSALERVSNAPASQHAVTRVDAPSTQNQIIVTPSPPIIVAPSPASADALDIFDQRVRESIERSWPKDVLPKDQTA